MKTVEEKREARRLSTRKHREKMRAAEQKPKAPTPAKSREYSLKHYNTHKEQARERHRAYIMLTTYGMTPEEYAVLLDVQDGVCAICHRPEMTVRAGRVQQLSVDHDHVTGRVRGLLCNKCNHGIGQFGDDVARLANAIAYLKRGQPHV